MRDIYYLLISLSLMCSCSEIMAQVTIGSKQQPKPGALLDLKQQDDDPNGVNSNKGLLLPRVKLSDLSKLQIGDEDEITGTEALKHTGLIVYNVHDNLFDICPGLYVWNSAQWNRISVNKCFSNSITPQQLIFYKTALVSKEVTLNSNFDNVSVLWEDATPATIPWLKFGSLTRDFSGKYYFQPDVNNTGADRTVVVKAKVSSDSKNRDVLLTIKQLSREMNFSYTPTSAFPALGAEQTIYVSSDEAPWSASIATNPSSMITDFQTAEQPSANNHPFKVTLDDNLTWAERIATLKITSSDPEFLERTLDVKQAHANPMLTITDATTINPTTNDATLNVTGTSATAPASIKFDTNSDWAFYEDNTGIANASAAGSVFSISSGSPTLNTTYNSGGLPLSPVSQSLNLYAPTTLPTAPHGTILQSNIVLENRNIGTVAPVKKNVLVQYSSPFRFDNLSILPASGNITTSGTTISLSANTNAAWNTYFVDATNAPSTRQGQVNQAARDYTTVNTNIAIPAYPYWDANWDANRVIELYKTHDDVNVTKIASYTQLGYNLFLNWTNLPAHGSTIPRAAHGYSLDMRTNSESTNFNTLSRLTSSSWLWYETGNVGSRSIWFTENASWYGRWVSAAYEVPYVKDVNLADYWQPGYDLNCTGSTVPSTAPAHGGWFNLYFNSVNGAPDYQIHVNEATTIWNSGYQPYATTRGVYIPGNYSGVDRYLNIYYERSGLEWVLAQTVLQQTLIDLGTHWGYPYIELPLGVYTWGQAITQSCADILGPGWYATNTNALAVAWQNSGYPWSLFGYVSGSTAYYYQLDPGTGTIYNWVQDANSIMPASYRASFKCVIPK